MYVTEFGLHADVVIIFIKLALRSTLEYFIVSMDNFNFIKFSFKLIAIIYKLHVIIPQKHHITLSILFLCFSFWGS